MPSRHRLRAEEVEAGREIARRLRAVHTSHRAGDVIIESKVVRGRSVPGRKTAGGATQDRPYPTGGSMQGAKSRTAGPDHGPRVLRAMLGAAAGAQ